MKPIHKPLIAAFGALAALGGLATATSAGAAVVCNQYHECWRVHDHMDYPAAAAVTVYDDTWKAPDTTYHWRKDRDDRGYWEHNRWHKF